MREISAHGGAPGQPPPAEGVSQGVKADSDVENPFYKGCIFTIVIFSMILGLQLISFNTTHAGADYYMRNIKKWAPVMFAAAVQGTIVLLSVFRFDSPPA